jgi:MurNAc alpha-1-phosphate uridylyltransferase
MVLAAGFGVRMRPITDNLPKPLIEVRGEAMIDTILNRLAEAGVETAVVNLHHLGDQIEKHLKKRKRPKILFSPEERILETGGGVRQALDKLGDAAFFVINGDVCWLDGRIPALQRLAAAWDDAEMDALLLLEPTVYALGYEGQAGDFIMDPTGRLRRRREREIAPFIFAGIQILHARLFENAPDGPFSLNLLYDRAQEAGRLWGLRHDGRWYHVGTPEALAEAEEALHYLADPTVER